jgi:transcriptional regulator with XRE-family HTH domain
MYETHLTPLRMARLKAGLTQFIVARKAKLSAARVSLLERGHDDATPDEKSALARVFGATPDQLFPTSATATSATLKADATASC